MITAIVLNYENVDALSLCKCMRDLGNTKTNSIVPYFYEKSNPTPRLIVSNKELISGEISEISDLYSSIHELISSGCLCYVYNTSCSKIPLYNNMEEINILCSFYRKQSIYSDVYEFLNILDDVIYLNYCKDPNYIEVHTTDYVGRIREYKLFL